MKDILIVFAMDEEYDAFASRHKGDIEIKNQLSVLVVIGADKTIYALKGGIGKVSMAYTLGLFLACHHVDLIINTGVCGTLSSDVRCLDTLVAAEVAYLDVDLTEFGYRYGQMSNCPVSFLADEKALKLISSIKDKKIKTGLLLSCDSFITRNNIKRYPLDRFENPLGIDMESGAIAQVCYTARIPFVIIRTISDDTTKDGNKDVYEKNLLAASDRASLITELLLNNY